MKKTAMTLTFALVTAASSASAADFVIGVGAGNSKLKFDSSSLGSETNKHLMLELGFNSKNALRYTYYDLGTFKGNEATQHALNYVHSWKVVDNGQLMLNAGISAYKIDYKIWATDRHGNFIPSSTGQPFKVDQNESSAGVNFGIGYRHTFNKIIAQIDYNRSKTGGGLKANSDNLDLTLGFKF